MNKMKTKLFILILIIIAICLTIGSIVYAKYILAKNFSIDYQTSSYYFDVEVDDISVLPSTVTVTVKNYSGSNYTDTDLTYSANIEYDSDVLTISDFEIEGILEGGSCQEQTYTFTVSRATNSVVDVEEEITINFSITSPYTDAVSKVISVNDELVGKYVDYTPASDNSFTAYATYTGYDEDQTFTTNTDLNWRIWSVTDDTLTLISETVANTEFNLKSYNGYNNAVLLLNSMCETLYSNSSIGATARSINLDDIEKISDYDPTGGTYNTYTYGILSTITTDSCRYYPEIFADEKNCYVDDVEGTLYNRSEQDSYYTGYSQAGTSILSPHNYYTYTFTQDYMDSIYVELLSYGNDSTSSYLDTYFLASRMYCLAATQAGSANYGIWRIGNGLLYRLDLFTSKLITNSDACAVRPIIEIDLTNISVDLTESGETSDESISIN